MVLLQVDYGCFNNLWKRPMFYHCVSCIPIGAGYQNLVFGLIWCHQRGVDSNIDCIEDVLAAKSFYFDHMGRFWSLVWKNNQAL